MMYNGSGTLIFLGKEADVGNKEGVVFFFGEILRALDYWPSYSLREDRILPRISGRNGKQLFGKEDRLPFYQALCSLSVQKLLVLEFDQGSRSWQLTEKGKKLLVAGEEAIKDAAEAVLGKGARPLNGRLPKRRGVFLVIGGDSYHVVPLDKNATVFLFNRS